MPPGDASAEREGGLGRYLGRKSSAGVAPVLTREAKLNLLLYLLHLDYLK